MGPGPVTRREILSLALPAAASAVLNNVFRIIDQYAAGSIGTSAQAAIGSCTFVLILVFQLWTILSAGAGPLVARAAGARDEALARRAFGNALTGSLVIGAGVAVTGWLGADAVAALLGLSGPTAADAATFLRTLALGAAPLAMAPVLDATLVALGRTRTMMALQLVAAGLNAALNPLFIHGLGWGIAGTAAATVVARLVASALGLLLLWRALAVTTADLRPDSTLPRMIRVGAPMAVNGVLYALVYFAILRTTISPLGPTYNAALGIGFSALEGFTYPVFLGLSLGVASVVGRRLGAGQPEEARRVGRLALGPTVAAGIGGGALFYWGAEPLCARFTTDPAVLDAAVEYARILAFSQLFVALEALAEGILAGAGATRPVFLVSAPLNVLRVPLGWALAMPLGWGAAGVWWAINLTTWVKCGGKGWLAARGAWVDTPV